MPRIGLPLRPAAAAAAGDPPPPTTSMLNPVCAQTLLLVLASLVLIAMACERWMTGSSSSSSSATLRGERPLPLVERWEPCERAQLNETVLQDWGCRVFHKTCFDQVRSAQAGSNSLRCMVGVPEWPPRPPSPPAPPAPPAPRPQAHILLHSGEKTPGHPNFTHGQLFPVLTVTDHVLPTGKPPDR